MKKLSFAATGRFVGCISGLLMLIACGSAVTDATDDVTGASKEKAEDSTPTEEESKSADDAPATDENAEESVTEEPNDEDSTSEAPSAEEPAPVAAPVAADPITCGDAECPVPPFGVPCCTTEAGVESRDALSADMCGVDLSELSGMPGCTELGQPGELDESCPEVELGGPPMPGCCTPQGICGAMDTFIGIGCMAPKDEALWTVCGD